MFIPPMVFDEYKENQDAIYVTNNCRDNLPSFHDIMKTYR
jgi:hypothetical protein